MRAEQGDGALAVDAPIGRGSKLDPPRLRYNGP
jgi:hypothetical protein